MLNGVDPIIIFNFKKKLASSSTLVGPVQPKIPLVAAADSITDLIDLPVIPIYLSERLTGIYIDTESKTIDVDSQTDTLTSGGTPQVNQKALASTIKIEMVARSSSIGLSLLSAMSDLILPKVTSKEYSITYLHGAVTVFAGLLHSFAITQEAGTDLYKVSIELIKNPASLKAAVQQVSRLTSAVPL